MKNSLIKIATSMALAIGLSAVGGQAMAVPVIDFGIVAPTSGSIDYLISGGSLVGTDITVDNVVGLGTPINDTVLRNCISCDLDFTTGALTSTTATEWNFGGGVLSSITITGGLDLNNDGDATDVGDIAVGSTLLSGTFGTATVTTYGNVFKIAGASFWDTKHSDLLSYYGIVGPMNTGNFNISFSAAGSPPSTFASTRVLSGDVINTVPEPTTLLLLGAGLVGLGIVGRKRIKA